MNIIALLASADVSPIQISGLVFAFAACAASKLYIKHLKKKLAA